MFTDSGSWGEICGAKMALATTSRRTAQAARPQRSRRRRVASPALGAPAREGPSSASSTSVCAPIVFSRAGPDSRVDQAHDEADDQIDADAEEGQQADCALDGRR